MPKRFNLDGAAAPQAAPAAPPSYAPTYAPPPPAPVIDATFTEIAPTPSTSTALSPLTGTPGKPLVAQEIITTGQAEAAMIGTTADKINAVAKMADMDEIGKLFTRTMMAAKGYDPDNLMKGGWLSWGKGKIAQMTIKFDSVDGSVKKLVGEVDQRIALFIQRIGDIKAMRTENENTRKALEIKIAELEARADWMDANVPEVDPNDTGSVGRRQEWIAAAQMGRVRARNLTDAKVNAEQQHAVLGMLANNSAGLAMKFGIIKETTIPAMKTGFAIAVMNAEQTKGVEFADMLDTQNNEIIQKNAKRLNQNVTAVQTALNRSSISLETLQIQQAEIFKALDEVERIRKETKERLVAEAPVLKQISSDLTKRLTQQ